MSLRNLAMKSRLKSMRRGDEFTDVPQTKHKLEQHLQATKKRAYAKGTLKNLMCQWRSFYRFSRKFKILEWPISEHTICLYAQYLAFSFHSPKAIKNYLYGIKTLHVLLQQPPPNLKHAEVRLTLRGLEKIMQHTPKQAAPLTPDILTDILSQIDISQHGDLVFWSILLVGFFGMLRKSNLLSDSRRSFDPIKQMTTSHVTFKPGLLIIKATWAKNIQARERVLEIPIFEMPSSPLCPVTAVKALASIQHKKHWPLFGKGHNPVFTYTQFQAKLKQTLNKCGYKGQAFSSHSMRRGGATWAHRSGVSESLIQVHGGWQSDAYKTYLTFPIEIRAAVSLRMRNAIINACL